MDVEALCKLCSANIWGERHVVIHISTKDMNEEIEKRLRTSRNERGTGPCLDWERDTMINTLESQGPRSERSMKTGLDVRKQHMVRVWLLWDLTWVE